MRKSEVDRGLGRFKRPMVIRISYFYISIVYVNNLLVLQNFTIARKSGNILSASGIYFGSPFGYYPTFHTLTSVRRKQYFQYVKRMFPLFRAIV